MLQAGRFSFHRICDSVYFLFIFLMAGTLGNLVADIAGGKEAEGV